jgi:NADH:ubiquinone oxidoreductase subunit B-like Fe-S oxidoreductase
VPGCPPRPECVIDALMALQRRIQSQPQMLGIKREQKETRG